MLEARKSDEFHDWLLWTSFKATGLDVRVLQQSTTEGLQSNSQPYKLYTFRMFMFSYSVFVSESSSVSELTKNIKPGKTHASESQNVDYRAR